MKVQNYNFYFYHKNIFSLQIFLTFLAFSMSENTFFGVLLIFLVLNGKRVLLAPEQCGILSF